MILVSTTVIEVGVNIPSATLMIIEDANRFGLSQLHQLRGRVARGNLQSHCILIHNKNLSEISKKRLMILKESSNGFEIAEKDLFLRGSGDFFGTNQSGLPRWKFFSPYQDLDFLEKTKLNCKDILESKNNKVSALLTDIFYKKTDFINFFFTLAFKGIIPAETIVLTVSSISVFKYFSCFLGTSKRNPDVGFGVVGTKTLTMLTFVLAFITPSTLPVVKPITQTPFLGYSIKTASLNALELL